MVFPRGFHVFEIYPSPESPDFRRIAALDDLDCNGNCAFMFTSEILVFFHGVGEYLLIWNFLEDTWAKWDTGRLIVDVGFSLAGKIAIGILLTWM
jgi:hypothetical protein